MKEILQSGTATVKQQLIEINLQVVQALHCPVFTSDRVIELTQQ